MKFSLVFHQGVNEPSRRSAFQDHKVSLFLQENLHREVWSVKVEGKKHRLGASSNYAAPAPFLWLLILIGGFLAFFGFVSLYRHILIMRWPVADGTITQAWVASENDSFIVRLRFEFIVEDASYEADTPQFLIADSKAEAEETRDKYRVGTEVTVRYDPSDPQRAFLVTETDDQAYIGLVVIGLSGILIVVFGWLPMRFPRLFQSERERVSDDQTPRFERRSILWTREQLCSLAEESTRLAQGEHRSDVFLGEVEVEQWRPGECVRFFRRESGLMPRALKHHVCIDWREQRLIIGPEGAEVSIPLGDIDEFRLQGVHEIRHRGGGKLNRNIRYEAWDIWLDAIVGSRRLRLVSRTEYQSPDEAFADAMRTSAPLSATFPDKPLRWVGFDAHPEYRPPRLIPGLAVRAYLDTAVSGAAPPKVLPAGSAYEDSPESAPVADIEPSGSEKVQQPVSLPLNSNIRIDESVERVRITIPPARGLPKVPGIGLAVLVGGFAAMISPAAFGQPEIGPRVFVGLLLLVPLIWFGQLIRVKARRGLIEATPNGLKVTTHGLILSHCREWSTAEVLTICVVPHGKSQGKLPIEALAIFRTDSSSAQFFPAWPNTELTWIAQTLRRFLSLPEPPAITQSDPQKAALEIARGIVHSQRDVMQQQLAEMGQNQARTDELLEEITSRSDRLDLQYAQQKRDVELSVKGATLSQSDIGIARAEMGLIDFLDWRPGDFVRYRHVTLSMSKILANALASVLGYLLVFTIVVPFAIPILGSILVIPFDIVGARRVHLVVADLFAFGTGLIAWVITFTCLAFVWISLKLDAAFAARETDWDWRQRVVTIWERSNSQSHQFREILRLNVREVEDSGAKGRKSIFRMEAELAGQDLVLLEAEDSDELDDLSGHSMSAAEQLVTLARDLGKHLDVETRLADPVSDRFTDAGYPRDARITDLFHIWRITSLQTRLLALASCAAIVAFWCLRFIQSYLENA